MKRQDVDEHPIIGDILSRSMTASKIAEKYGVSVNIINRIIREHRIGIGRGKVHVWNYTTMSPELAYIAGAYITDGWIKFEYKTKTPRQMSIAVTSEEFSRTVYEYLRVIGCKSTIKYNDKIHPSRKGKKPQWITYTCASDFCKWIYEATQNKQKIPDEIMASDANCKIAFLCGVIDGDGHLDAYDGLISVSNCDTFLFDLPALLDSLEVKHSDVTVRKILPSGLTLWRVAINRKDFLCHNPTLYVTHKQARLYGDLLKKPKRKNRVCKKYPCSNCGQVIASKPDALCNACYRTSDLLLSRLREQSSRAGVQANIVRWGKKE